MNRVNRPMSSLVKIIYSKSGHIDREQVNLACNYLEKGGVIAVPTDTIYGLAAKLDDLKAIDKIYQIKGRDLSKPLSVCLSSINDIDQVTEQKLPQNILRTLLPGPTTILLRRGKNLNENLNPGIQSIGVRVPDHNFIMALAHIVGPLALTSANRSGESSPLEVRDFVELWPELDCVFDNGLLQTHNEDDNPNLNKRLGSTVVDLTSEDRKFKIIREGCSLNRTIALLKKFGYRNAIKKETSTD